MNVSTNFILRGQFVKILDNFKLFLKVRGKGRQRTTNGESILCFRKENGSYDRQSWLLFRQSLYCV